MAESRQGEFDAKSAAVALGLLGKCWKMSKTDPEIAIILRDFEAY